MYLKSLHILGFKSFADKTTLDFQRGITAIVGPNGCGKSNVSDALRWVLGEQSAKALRGGEMKDVIFNGAERRKPLGMAEVSLTIGDIDAERLKVAGVDLGYNEVTITRRVYRDGGSDYFLNKTKCRLRDIQRLFMGTGMGRTSYSILAQGHITQLLSSKPDDRRTVFEEAAGITAFKSQKKEALRKLDNTEQNLDRIDDRIKEVQRQIGSLQRQAAKARRYKEISENLKALETRLSKRQFDALSAQVESKASATTEASAELESVEAQILQAESSLSEGREKVSVVDETLTEARAELSRVENLIQQHCHRIELNEQRLRELKEQNERANLEITQSEERKRAAESELALVTQQIDNTAGGVQERRVTVDEAQEALRKVERELSEQQSALVQRQQEANSIAQKLTRARSEANELALKRQRSETRLEQIEAERAEITEESQRIGNLLEGFSTDMAKDRAEVEARRETATERRARIRDLEAAVEERGAELAKLQQQIAEIRSRRAVLEQLQAAREGFDEGAVAALKESENALGFLVDFIRAPEAVTPLVELALNGALQWTLTRSAEDARRIIDHLKEGKRGRASIATLELAPQAQTAPADQINGHRRLIDQLDVDEQARPLVEQLIGETYITPNLEAALDARAKASTPVHFVTEEGELLSREGVMTGGRGANAEAQKASSALSRKNEIEELDRAAEKARVEAENLSREKGALQADLTQARATLEEVESELQTTQVAIANREGELRALESAKTRLHMRDQQTLAETHKLREERDRCGATSEEITHSLDALETEERDARAGIDDLANAIEGVRSRRDEATSAHSEARIALNSEEKTLESLRGQQKPLSRRIEELTQLMSRRRDDLDSFVSRRDESLQHIEESRNAIQGFETDRETQSEEVLRIGEEKKAIEATIREFEDRLRQARNQEHQLQRRHSDLEVELAQKRMAIENLRERIQEKYQLEVESIDGGPVAVFDRGSGNLEIQPLEEGEEAPEGATSDWDAIGTHVKELQSRIDSMGPVNLVAIEEYEETEERYNFLAGQRDDLVNAREQLLDAINKINTETGKMFSDTFATIQKNFKEIFTEIFGGGKAELQLVDEEDALESGIEIVARPPGKQLQSITLLSGGEQTMTAVALLFAIYMVRPSPFCVLDELDAPLDESNIRRFIAVLQRFVSQSQFIIITHNKRTISIADVLYGVTMQERGVSRIVSYQFKKTEEEANPAEKNGAPKELDAPAEEVEEPVETTEAELATAAS